MKFDGSKLRQARKSSDMTQDVLGELTSVTAQAIYNYEQNKRQPSPEFIQQISKIFNKLPEFWLDRKLLSTTGHQNRIASLKTLISFADGECRFLANQEGVFDLIPFPIDVISEDFRKLTDQQIITNFFAYKNTNDNLAPRIRKGDILIIEKTNRLNHGTIGLLINDNDEIYFKQVLKTEYEKITCTLSKTDNDCTDCTNGVEKTKQYYIKGKVVSFIGKTL